MRSFVRRRGGIRLSGWLIAWLVPLSGAGGQLAPDMAEPGSIEAIAEFTSEARFSSPWVAYVPEAAGIPSPTDYLGRLIGQPGELTRVEVRVVADDVLGADDCERGESPPPWIVRASRSRSPVRAAIGVSKLTPRITAAQQTLNALHHRFPDHALAHPAAFVCTAGRPSVYLIATLELERPTLLPVTDLPLRVSELVIFDGPASVPVPQNAWL